MANTFDIRFDRSVGLASIFDAPANSFRWKGAGELSVDAEGIRVALKRSLVSLLVRQRSRRIPAQDIKEVYREGEALRVEFATEENARTVLPFWTRDRDTAAQIVRLLPTSRTIELEESTSKPAAGRSRRAVALSAIVLLAAGAALFVSLRPASNVEALRVPVAATDNVAAVSPKETPASVATSAAASTGPTAQKGDLITEEEARKLALMAEKPVDWTPPPQSSGDSSEHKKRPTQEPDSPPAAEPGAEVEAFVPDEVPPINVGMTVVPFQPGTLAYDAARSLLRRFEAAAMRVDADFVEGATYIESGRFNTGVEAKKLDANAAAWRDLGERLLNSNEARNPDLAGLRATLLGVVSYRARAFEFAAQSLRTKNIDLINQARQDFAKASDLMDSARKYLG